MNNDNKNLSKDEMEQLKNLISQMEAGEMAQVQDLIDNCNITYEFAKTHSVYVKDWEKTKQEMEYHLSNGVLPPGVSAELFREVINASDKVIQKKLKKVQNSFQQKFGESIFNYIGNDGKTNGCLGVVLFFVITGMSLLLLL